MVTSFTDWDRDPNHLAHFGTKGMKWGQRRFQNPDGSLTALGKERYGVKGDRSARGMARDLNKLDREKVTSQYRIDKKMRKIAKKDDRYARKISEAEKSGKSGKATVLKAKREENLNDSRNARKVKEYRELIQKNAKMANRILASAKQNGYKISTKQTKRIVNKGALIAKGILATAAAGTAGYFLGQQAVRGTPMRFQKTYTPNGVMSVLRPDSYQLSRRMKTANTLGRVIGGTLGGAAGSSVKLRKGTKYRVQNKYRNR